MKQILIIVLLLTLISCDKPTRIIDNQNVNFIENKDIGPSDSTKIKKIEEKISWSGDLKFIYCDSLSKYEDKQTYNSKEEVKLLLEKLKEIKYDSIYLRSNLNNVGEYCKNASGDKYIFWAHNDHLNYEIKLFTYDKKLDKIGIVNKNTYFGKYIHSGGYITLRNYGDISLEKYLKEYVESKKDISGFGVKQGNIVPFANYGVSITGHQESAPGMFSDKFQYFSKETRDYCQSGLTPKGKLSVCFVDIFYDYNFVENNISESRVCSYYIDDDGEIKTLEKCLDFTVMNKGYTLKSKSKGVDFYQNETGNLSILEVDLNSVKISFAGLNTKYEKEELAYSRTKISTELEYKSKNSEFERFNKYYAKDFKDKTELDYKVYTISTFINGQFFTKLGDEKTGLSFPIKSNGKIVTSYLDNDIPKRTFIIDNNLNAKILEGYKKEYLENPNNKELIVAFTPDVTARKDAKIGRTYTGLKDSKHIVFFIAKDKNQKQMNTIINDYGIRRENIIMMDGGPSSQFAYFDNKGPGSDFEQYYGKWEVPHYFILYND